MNEQVIGVLKHPATIPAVVGVVVGGISFTAGYILGFRRGESRVWDLVVDELSDATETEEDDAPERVIMNFEDLEAMRDRWQEQNVVPAEEVLSERVLSPEEVRERYETIELIDEDDEPEPDTVEVNIFANTGEGWDYDKEVADREGERFYVIHVDEYTAQESGYSQHTLTYYAGDDLMADEQEELVINYQRTVGELRFGHGSNDPNVVFVRNDEREAEYEILLHNGMYTKEVLNLDVESDRASTKIRRMRPTLDEVET